MKAILQGQKVSGLPSGGATGQVLTKTETGSSWQDTVKELPEDGTAGQILEKTEIGTKWVDKSSLFLSTITLNAAGWSSNSQTVNVNGILADSNTQNIQVSPKTSTDADNWGEAGIWCDDNSTANQLTFTCKSVPSENIQVNIAIQEVS